MDSGQNNIIRSEDALTQIPILIASTNRIKEKQKSCKRFPLVRA